MGGGLHGTVEREDVVKGYEVDKDHFVVITQAEIDGVRLYVHVAFVWPLGTPGVLGRSPREFHPFQVSLVLRRWVREQRN
jgi:hypothetical protein